MDATSTRSSARRPHAGAIRLFAAVLVCAALLAPAAAARAAGVSMTVEPMLGSNVRPGAWAGFRVHLENDGPAVSGELRITGGAQGDSSYGTPVELPTGARQDHLLYAQPTWFGAKLSLSLVSGTTVVATQVLKVTTLDPATPTVVVVAERPEGIVGDIRSAATSPQFQTPVVLTIAPKDLPPRVEAWSAIDRLVWQDADSSLLSDEQRAALATWISAGGRFVVVGGTTGITGLSGMPAGILPFHPTGTVDVSPRDLATLLGTLPAGAASAPAISGTFDHGSILARSGDVVFAAQAAYGQGTVTVIGVDPALKWLAGTATAQSLWKRALPPMIGASINPLNFQDDSQLVATLNNLPAVALPDIAQLFIVLLAYIALIGPINYLVLRRLDRREWAWVTMPLLVVVFAVAAYGLGLGLKGTDVIVNQVGIIRGATGTERAIGQYYVGIFSPTRQTFDVRIAEGALLTNPTYMAQQGATGVPLDVVQGDTSHLRGYQVGFGVLRSFRAEAAVTAPRVDSDLSYSNGHLTGTLTNRSKATLERVAVVYGGNVAVIPSLAPDASAPVDIDVSNAAAFQGQQLSERILGPQTVTGTGQEMRTTYTRRTVIDQITAYSDTLGGYGTTQQGPVVLAFVPGASLPIDVGTEAQQVGDSLAILPASVKIVGPQIFPDRLISHGVIDSKANEATDQGASFSLGRGTMTVDFRPLGFSGDFEPALLSIALTQGDQRILAGVGTALAPLPSAQQPDQTDPVGSAVVGGGTGDGGSTGGVVGGGGDAVPPPDAPPGKGGAVRGPFDGLPDLQLFDRGARLWVEFPHLVAGSEYVVADPARYVDGTGAFMARFVNRGGQDTGTYFSLAVRLEGTVK